MGMTSNALPNGPEPTNGGEGFARALTLGERRIRTDFNASNSTTVDTLKRRFAALIDDVEALRNTSTDPEQARLISLAQTGLEESAMWAVKAATCK